MAKVGGGKTTRTRKKFRDLHVFHKFLLEGIFSGILDPVLRNLGWELRRDLGNLPAKAVPGVGLSRSYPGIVFPWITEGKVEFNS